jgi:hypothetical protein
VADGREGEHLLAAVQELYSELGYSEAAGGPSSDWLQGDGRALWEEFEIDGDGMVAELRAALAKLAHATRPGGREERAVLAALDGAELVMMGEIAAERPQMIETHLPGFAFLVALPGLGRERAIAASRRVEELIERRR